MAMDKNSSLIALHENPNSPFGKLPYEAHSLEERVFLHVWELEAEVNNGGFEQYFRNSAGDHSGQVVSSLRAISAPKAAAIVQRAISSVFGDTAPPEDRNTRQAKMDDLPDEVLEALNECDNLFFAYPDDLTELLFEYVRVNRQAIRGASGIAF
jgi:hypothetical protein